MGSAAWSEFGGACMCIHSVVWGQSQAAWSSPPLPHPHSLRLLLLLHVRVAALAVPAAKGGPCRQRIQAGAEGEGPRAPAASVQGMASLNWEQEALRAALEVDACLPNKLTQTPATLPPSQKRSQDGVGGGAINGLRPHRHRRLIVPLLCQRRCRHRLGRAAGGKGQTGWQRGSRRWQQGGGGAA